MLLQIGDLVLEMCSSFAKLAESVAMTCQDLLTNMHTHLQARNAGGGAYGAQARNMSAEEAGRQGVGHFGSRYKIAYTKR